MKNKSSCSIVTLFKFLNALKCNGPTGKGRCPHILKNTVKPVLRGHIWDKEKVSL